jgi:hypothetical protein
MRPHGAAFARDLSRYRRRTSAAFSAGEVKVVAQKGAVATVMLAILILAAEQTWWVRALLGGAVGASVFVAAPAGYTWVMNKFWPIEIAVGCMPTVMPTKLPADGFQTVTLYPGGGGSGIKSGETGAITGWPSGQLAYRCDIRNLSDAELPALSITLPIEYRNADGTAIDEARRHGRITVITPHLEGKSNKPFSFYVQAPQEFGAKIEALEVAYYQDNASNRAIKIKNQSTFPHRIRYVIKIRFQLAEYRRMRGV